jgi:hypothetical protein
MDGVDLRCDGVGECRIGMSKDAGGDSSYKV